MKKLLVAMLAGVMLFGLAGCGASETETALIEKTDALMNAIKTHDADYLHANGYEDQATSYSFVENRTVTYDERLDVDNDLMQKYYDKYWDAITYKITKIDEEASTVTVDVTRFDTTDFFYYLWTWYGDASDDDILGLIDPNKTVTDSVEIEYTTDDNGGYIVQTFPDGFPRLLEKLIICELDESKAIEAWAAMDLPDGW